MKKYSFVVTVFSGNDEFWEDATAGGNSGCDSVRVELQSILTPIFPDCEISLAAYQDNNLLA